MPRLRVFTSADTLFPHNLGGTQLRGGTSVDTLVLQDYGENKNVLVTCADSGVTSFPTAGRRKSCVTPRLEGAATYKRWRGKQSRNIHTCPSGGLYIQPQRNARLLYLVHSHYPKSYVTTPCLKTPRKTVHHSSKRSPSACKVLPPMRKNSISLGTI